MKGYFSTSIVLSLVVALSACGDSSSESATTNTNSGSEEATSVYRVSSTDLSLSLQTGGENQTTETAVWNDITSLLPTQTLKDNVEEYHVFSDGVEGTLAYVGQIEANEYKWLFAADSADSENTASTEFVKTVVHEFAHILGLESSQVEPGVPQDQCSTSYPVDEGCPVSGAIILAWFDQFWSGETYTAHQQATANLEGEEKEAAIADFYADRTDMFINEYSATDPIEDFAETFAYFVLSDLVQSPANVKEEKLAFFQSYSVMTETRDHVRAQTSVRVSIPSD